MTWYDCEACGGEIANELGPCPECGADVDDLGALRFRWALRLARQRAALTQAQAAAKARDLGAIAIDGNTWSRAERGDLANADVTRQWERLCAMVAAVGGRVRVDWTKRD